MADTIFFSALPLPTALKSNNYLHIFSCNGKRNSSYFVVHLGLCTFSLRKPGISLSPFTFIYTKG